MQPSTKTALTCDRLPSQMLALEPRYLFDAAAAATVADTTSDTASNDTGSADTSLATSSQDSTQDNAAVFLTQVSAASIEADLAPDSQSFFIPENAAEGSRAGFIATNPDVGEVTYTVTGGSGEDAFAVNPNTGEIIITDSSRLNFEAFDGDASLTLDVLITKELGNGDTELEQIEATVFLGDVNDPPVVEPVENQVATVGETLTVQIVAHDEDGDEIFYQLKDAPDGASIDSNGLFTWTPAPGQETDSTTTISIFVSDGALGTSTTTLVDFDFVIERVNPINDTNNGDPSRSPSVISGSAASTSSSEQIIDSSIADEIIGKTVSKEIATSDTTTDVDLLLLEIAELENYGLDDLAAIDTEIDEVQALIAEGVDPTQITPSTAAGFSKQVTAGAQSQTTEVAEIMAIMEEVTALLGCNR
ncbi:MAG: LEPR-XLL domain-containing protein [Pseudomonadota bacterium]